MLSFPLIPPQPDSQALHINAPFRPLLDYPPGLTPGSQTNQQQQQHNQQYHRLQQQRRDEERKIHNVRSPLALLAADEAAIANRKAAIRNFGAYWIRPPGISKTLQAMTEELAEQAEQEEMQRQEQGMRDLQAQQELQEARERAAEAAAQEGEEGEEERDLDEEIPDAEEGMEEEDEDEEDVTFNEDSMLEGSMGEGLAMEEAELTGAARDEEELGIAHEAERYLDDSVPEAGSYQHTDTEAEDLSSDSELQDSFARPNVEQSARSSRHRQPVFIQGANFETSPDQQAGLDSSLMAAAPAVLQGGLQQRIRAQAGGEILPRSPANWDLSSSLIESSLVGSSPVVQHNVATRGGARRRGRGSRS